MGCEVFEGDGFTLYFLEGDWHSMGAFFGEAIRSRLAGSPLEYYLANSDRILRHALQGYPRPLVPLARWLTKYLLLFPVALGTSRENRAFLRGMARGIGVPYLDLLLTYSSADAFNLLASVLTRLSNTAIPQVPAGCTSFVAWGGATRDGMLYHGRNLDFTGGPRWSNRHIILALNPTTGIPSITVSGDGVYIPGVSSTNREGLSMSLHLNFTRDVNFIGRNALTLASKAISEARDLTQAMDIIEQGKRVSGWTFILSHSSSRQGTLIELSGNRAQRIEPEKDWLICSNCYLSQRMKETEYAPSYTWVEDHYSRYQRLGSLLEKYRGLVDAASGVKILGDRVDITCRREVILGNGVGAIANVSSVIFSPEQERLWMATGPAPPNGSGRFVELSIGEIFDGKAPVVQREYPGNPIKGTKKGPLEYYMEALQRWDEKMDLTGAIDSMNRAIAVAQDEPLFLMVRGLFLAKAKEYEAAKGDFEGVLKSFLSPYRKAQALLWLGRLADLQGKREEAIGTYREVIGTSRWLDITRAAWHHLQKPYSVAMLRRMDVAPLMADYIDY